MEFVKKFCWFESQCLVGMVSTLSFLLTFTRLKHPWFLLDCIIDELLYIVIFYYQHNKNNKYGISIIYAHFQFFFMPWVKSMIDSDQYVLPVLQVKQVRMKRSEEIQKDDVALQNLRDAIEKEKYDIYNVIEVPFYHVKRLLDYNEGNHQNICLFGLSQFSNAFKSE